MKNQLCKFENCMKKSIYNISNEKEALYCNKHKLENMIDVKLKRCIFIGCMNIPYYNYYDINMTKKAIYCKEHKLLNMIDIRQRRCKFIGCPIIPSFNIDGEKKAIYCKKHKLPNMIDTRHRTRIRKSIQQLTTNH